MEWEEALLVALAVGLPLILLIGFCWIAWPSANRRGGICQNCKCERLCASCTGCSTSVCAAATGCCAAAFRCCGNTAKGVERAADEAAPSVQVAQEVVKPSATEPDQVVQAVPMGREVNQRVVGVHDDCYGCYSSFCLDCGVLNRVCCQCTWLSSWRAPATSGAAKVTPAAPSPVEGVPVADGTVVVDPRPANPDAADPEYLALLKRFRPESARSEEALPLLTLPLSR